MKCSTCREKDAELLTWWERFRNWLFLRTNHIFYPQDFDDLKSDKFTQGYADGYIAGTETERHSHERMRELYEPKLKDIPVEQYVQKRLEGLLSPIDTNLIATFNDRTRQVYIGGILTDEARLANLRSEAEALMEFDLWNIIYETPKALAQKAMFSDDGKLETQLLKGRAMLYLLDTQKRIIDTFKSFKPVDKVPSR